MSQIAPQILNAPLCLQKPFAGASKASAIHHISNGTMQKIKLDRGELQREKEKKKKNGLFQPCCCRTRIAQAEW